MIRSYFRLTFEILDMNRKSAEMKYSGGGVLRDRRLRDSRALIG